MTTIVDGADAAAAREMGYEEWRAVVRAVAGRYSPEGIDPRAFTGKVQVRSLFGLGADLFDCNAHRIERRQRDVRLDDVEFYHAVFQVAGRSTVLQNDQAVTLDVGEVVLIDSTRPVTYVAEASLTRASARWLSLQLPRRSLLSHLGLEPRGGSQAGGSQAGGSQVGGSGARRATRAGRLLFQLVLDEFSDDPASAPASAYMQLAVYDLIGALFAPADPRTVSPYTDKQFDRIRAIIRDRFADPDLSPREVAAAAGISLRYLQKLFTQRGATCCGFINSLRLDHAARLLQGRALAGTRQPISEIAYASGFADYGYFSRKFRKRFGHAPGASRV